jgi:DNA-binding response OmpR family regulator
VAIHIVEDDPGVSDSLQLTLKAMGLEAVAHPDAETFFEVATPSAADTIIVDLALPGLSGATIIRWLQLMQAPPRVIAITGQSQTRIDRELRGLHVGEVFRKPLSTELIAAVI